MKSHKLDKFYSWFTTTYLFLQVFTFCHILLHLQFFFFFLSLTFYATQLNYQSRLILLNLQEQINYKSLDLLISW